MPTKDEIWEAQLREYPNSRRLSGEDVADWVLEKDLPIEQQRVRAYHVTIALPYENGVWYRTEAEDTPADTMCGRPAGGWMGFRYGVEGHEYFSGFTYL